MIAMDDKAEAARLRAKTMDRDYWARLHIRGDRSAPVQIGCLGGGRRVARGGGTRRERGGHKVEERE